MLFVVYVLCYWWASAVYCIPFVFIGVVVFGVCNRFVMCCVCVVLVV